MEVLQVFWLVWLLVTNVSTPILETCTVSDLQTLIDSGKKFGTIYADPFLALTSSEEDP